MCFPQPGETLSLHPPPPTHTHTHTYTHTHTQIGETLPMHPAVCLAEEGDTVDFWEVSGLGCRFQGLGFWVSAGRRRQRGL
jgi:hypothetical protein